jgi:hypothetical protein
MKTRRSTVAIASLLTTVALSITGCGGGSSSNATSTRTPPAAPSGVDPSQIKAIRQCLKAAGLNQTIPQGGPSGMPTDLPSDLPSNPPSGVPTDIPSNFSGGPGGQFNDPKIQAALKACGIQLPTPRGG